MSVEVGGRRVALTSLDRPLWPSVGFAKRDLVAYYAAVAPVLVRHLAGRPVMLGRWPSGIEGRGWGQFDCRGRPDWMRTFPMVLRDGGRIELCVIDDAAALVWAANQGTIELHPYGGRVASFEQPLAVVLDLDPGERVGRLAAAAVALEIRDRLERIGLASVVKTSGRMGMHVVVPLSLPHSYAEARTFARGLAEQLSEDHPNRILSTMSRADRAGRVFVDWVQNSARRQNVAPYSLRATDVPRVSTPLAWEEVEAAVRARDPRRLVFDPAQVLARIGTVGDLFEPALSLRQRLPAARGTRPAPEAAMAEEPIAPDVTYDGGPRHGQREWMGDLPAVIGDGSEGGVYQKTDEQDGVLRIYRWRPLSDAEANALLRADLRANQR